MKNVKHFAEIFIISVILLFATQISYAQKKNKSASDEKTKNDDKTFSFLKFRNIGPAYCSGRIADFAVNPNNHAEYFVAVASGNLWKTTNAGTTWKPIFDNHGSYSTASVVIDPNNHNVVWLGTGEYNSQRAIGYGDGVYRSEDGGATWKNTGLKKSEHIGRIIIDPRNSHVYVAAQGPLWGAGGERGIYKTTDNGKTWQQIFFVSDDTGINDIVLDPRNPDVLYASAYQRRRHVWTLIDGGKESAIYKSTDAGKNWVKLTKGLPSGDVGRIGLTISPVNPDYIYAIIELPNTTGGFYRSTNSGASWTKMSDHVSSSPQYYQRIMADPQDADKVFSLSTYTYYTKDGGKTWKRLSLKNRHVDDHAMWIDPTNTNHFLIGGDGGIYETWDHSANWMHKQNLSVAQFYRISTDNSYPFYNVYGGTQDNNSMGGPSQTKSDGIVNDDWFITVGGDGYKSQVDPENPNIVYAQWQYGGLIRYDRTTGESIDIKPRPPINEAYRWNWNTPLIISPHSNTRLYFAANKLFRSDDRGNSWKVISPDLTAQIDRNQLEVMGKVQFPDAVAKNASTSLFGNIVSLCESSKKEGLIYVGTDDGLVQITENGGEAWTKVSSVSGVSSMTYVSCLFASQHDENVVYASFDNRKRSDFKPYLFKSTNKGKSWVSIAANLPKNGSVFSVVEDHKNPNLLFVGTEFGIFLTVDGGKKWSKMKNGMPVIPVKDIVIQKRENDLVIATFGRGIFVLDDYSPLQNYTAEILKKEAHLFPVKDAKQFVKKRGRSASGASYFKAPNPAYGATFTYHLKSVDKTLKAKRKKQETEADKNETSINYPSFSDLRAEKDEESPYLLFTVTDENGKIVRNIKVAQKAGINRIVWDLQYNSKSAPDSDKDTYVGKGGAVIPGKYFVTFGKIVGGEYTKLTEAVPFNVILVDKPQLPVKDFASHNAYRTKATQLGNTARVVSNKCETMLRNAKKMKAALLRVSGETNAITNELNKIIVELTAVKRAINGDETIRARNANQQPSLMSRARIANGVRGSVTNNATETMKQQYEIAKKGFEEQLTKLNALKKRSSEVSKKLEQINAPWTPEREPKF